MTDVKTLRRGFNIRLAGAPMPDVSASPDAPTVAVLPARFEGLRPRLKVKEGDAVRRGTPLVEDKSRPAFQLCAPAGGVVKAIVFGERRSLQRVVIEVAQNEEAEPFARYDRAALGRLPRGEALELLTRTGYLALVRQRPYAGIADPAVEPKAIFVNGMNTAPYTPDLHAALRGDEAAFQAGLDVLGRLTKGKVHLCLSRDAAHPSPAATGARGVEVHSFRGPHPAGNTSVHIHHIDPLAPHDRVWTVRGTDVPLLGRLFLEGALPTHRVVSLAGPGVRPGERRHYRVRLGAELAPLLAGRVYPGEWRTVSGDVLSGRAEAADGYLPFGADALTLVREDRRRVLLGWQRPGFDQFSRSRLFLSTWLHRVTRWELGTNLHGGRRAMVVTGLYDRVLPMRILVDYLVRAVLARDMEEAVRLGLLETVPEDFALCSFVCPSKTDVAGIIREGLREAEAEGF